MNEYINREDLMDARQKAIWVYENANILNASAIRENLKPLLDQIVDLPTANVSEIKHGRWITGLDGSCMCSECGRVFRYEIGYYCAWCGAKLESEWDDA